MKILLRISVLVALSILLQVNPETGDSSSGDISDGLAEQGSTVAGGWNITCLECPHYFTDMSGHSAVLDSQENVHIAYGGKQLYYARVDNNGGSQGTIVDPTFGAGKQATLALDSLEQPHILYQAANDAGLKHAWFDGSVWQIMPLVVGKNPWLVSASDGTLRATWLGGGSLFYGIFDNQAWQTILLGPAQGYPSLALDSQQNPHIAYMSGGINHHATFDGATWQITDFNDGMVGSYPAIAITDNDDVHIVHNNDSYIVDAIVHRYRIGNLWQTEVPDVGFPYYNVYHRRDYSLAAGSNGHLYLAFSEYHQSVTPYPWYDYSELCYSEWDGSNWSNFPCGNGIWTSLAESTHASIVINNQNEVLVAFKSESDLALGDPWNSFITLDQGGIPSGEIHLEGDSFGSLHALVGNSETRKYHYLTTVSDVSDWMIQGGGLAGYPVGSPQLALAVGSSQAPNQPSVHIVYDQYSRVGDETSYRVFGGVGGVYGRGGGYYDVAVDSQEGGHLTVHDGYYLYFATPVDLNYPNVWEEELVDASVSVGRMSLVMDGQDFGRLAYPGVNSLRYARQTVSGWITETITAGQADYISLALDSSERPHIAWYDVNQSALKYAFHDGVDWQINIIDDSGDVGQFASLGLDEFDQPHISYFNADGEDLKYAYFNGGQWAILTLISDGNAGSHGSLYLVDYNNVYIAYLDSDRGDVMLIYREFEPTEAMYLPLVAKSPN